MHENGETHEVQAGGGKTLSVVTVATPRGQARELQGVEAGFLIAAKPSKLRAMKNKRVRAKIVASLLRKLHCQAA